MRLRVQAAGAARHSVSAPALFLSASGAASFHDKAGKQGTTPNPAQHSFGTHACRYARRAGGFGDLSTRMIKRRDTLYVTDTGETIPSTSDDQILVHGALESGAAFSIHYRGGMSRGTNLLWEINGTKGDIQVTGAHGHGQIVQLSIRGANGNTSELIPLTPPASAYDGWPDNSVARNVARVYALIAQDIQSGRRSVPSFRDAVALHETIDAIERSAARDA
jgi:predicted dehydrogenase